MMDKTGELSRAVRYQPVVAFQRVITFVIDSFEPADRQLERGRGWHAVGDPIAIRCWRPALDSRASSDQPGRLSETAVWRQSVR